MNKLSQQYNDWHNNNLPKNLSRTEEAFNIKALDMLDAKGGQKLLDVGCGKGSFCISAFKRGLKVTGVDFSEVAINHAKSLKLNIEFIIEDAHFLPFKDQLFDFVVCLGSLEHFSDKKQVLKEINRVLKIDGLAFFFLPNSYFLGHVYLVLRTGMPPDEGKQDFSEDFNTSMGWKVLLEENGFNVQLLSKFNTIIGSNKVSPLIKFIYNRIIKYFIPFNLSYSFGYLCKKK